MTVYVETNFVLELALGQEQSQSCRTILQLAEADEIRLVIPAYSLMEPYEKLIRDAQRRQSLAEDLEQELTQLGRADAFEQKMSAFEELAALLTRRREEEMRQLREAKETMLRVASLLPLRASVLEESLQLQRSLDLSPQDACVLATVLERLRSTAGGPENPETRCFVNRDAPDFSNPDIEERLERYGCQIKYHFDDGLAFIRSQIS
jgi:predicted nucleic acid-binding protein